ncbi:DNA-methyltransferase [uncultured Methylobacterium sp.]|uniref:DNA-methyltransferase n=1 Tax=uncultured Methylobacterium sp. TaxID=157278 RepID=UPI0035CC562E
MNVFASHHGRRFAAYHVDTVEFTADMPDDCIDLSVYSPPFSKLYIYNNSERDMGNVASNDEFQANYRELVRELFRVTKPGRNTAIHVKDLVYYSNSSERGDRGLYDFTGDCIRTHVAEGWSFHRRITIDRCPVREMQKTKSDRLLYKNFRTDAARTGGGMPEYILVFRKWAPGMEAVPPVLHDPALHPLESWQDLAQPIWMTDGVWRDTDETDVLNVRVARDEEAEKHLCPMPLDLTERLVRQYSNPDETVYSPFMGIGSEGYAGLRHGRRFIGTELKESYFRQAVKYLGEAERLGADGDMLAALQAAE